MQTTASAPSAQPAPTSVILKKTDGEPWTLLEMNRLRQAGVRVDKVPGQPMCITATGKPRGDRSFMNVLYHGKFEIVGRGPDEDLAAPLAS
jgi:hypothetical protein